MGAICVNEELYYFNLSSEALKMHCMMWASAPSLHSRRVCISSLLTIIQGTQFAWLNNNVTCFGESGTQLLAL